MDSAVRILEITKAELVRGYCVHLHFNDNTEQWIDFKPFLERSHHPDIRKYLNLTEFQRFRIEYGDLVWGDYELCFPISDLYKGRI